MNRSLRHLVAVTTAALTAMCAVPAVADTTDGTNAFGKINHIVVIYEENHSFDNLYGGWEGVNGRANATAAQTTQIGQSGAPYSCLLQNDVNLASPQLPATCTDTTTGTLFSSAFTNQPFNIGTYIPASALTCPQPGAFFQHGSLPNAANL